MEKTRYALFDFDGTLTRHDSFTGMIRFISGFGGLMLSALRSLPALVAWKLGRASNAEAKQRMFRAAFGGMEADDFANACRAYSARIELMTRRDTLSALEEALKRGDRVAIVSASIADWIRPWAIQHGIEHVIATEAEVDRHGILTGRFATPNCHGAEKVRRILEAFPELSGNRENMLVAAYGDSAGDYEMLAFADEPHFVK